MVHNVILFGETTIIPETQPAPIITPIPPNPEKQPLPPDPFKIPMPHVTPDTQPTPKA